MTKPTNPKRQVRQRAESLEAAGVEWVPARGELPPVPDPVPLPVLEPGVDLVPTLFDTADNVETADATSMTVEQRQAALEALAQRVAGCVRCPQLAATRTQTVF